VRIRLSGICFFFAVVEIPRKVFRGLGGLPPVRGDIGGIILSLKFSLNDGVTVFGNKVLPFSVTEGLFVTVFGNTFQRLYLFCIPILIVFLLPFSVTLLIRTFLKTRSCIS
jgi:hypothetical protein